MFRSFLLILFLCGLTVVSVVLEYKASAETFACPPTRVCLPKAPPPCETLPCVLDVKPPDCEPLDCDVSRPLLRRARACVAEASPRNREKKSTIFVFCRCQV
ncbi:hypothetical protein C6503_21305 [Candidatus Poribacteria bacterium]|nr:MAG: hypothetical protein C6503_21305 [Candidatus Poribacteria bacterium]